MLDATILHNPGGVSAVQQFDPANYYQTHLSFGKNIAVSVGMEFGDRYFTCAKDSSAAYYQFTSVMDDSKNYFSNAQVLQHINSYTLGFTFPIVKSCDNFWRGRGHSVGVMDMTMELMYAPEVNYDSIFHYSPYGVFATQDYTIDQMNVKHWGFRLLAECGGGGNLSFHQELGFRPNISPTLNHAKGGVTSRIYITMGASFCFGLGGRKVKYGTTN